MPSEAKLNLIDKKRLNQLLTQLRSPIGIKKQIPVVVDGNEVDVRTVVDATLVIDLDTQLGIGAYAVVYGGVLTRRIEKDQAIVEETTKVAIKIPFERAKEEILAPILAKPNSPGSPLKVIAPATPAIVGVQDRVNALSHSVAEARYLDAYFSVALAVEVKVFKDPDDANSDQVTIILQCMEYLPGKSLDKLDLKSTSLFTRIDISWQLSLEVDRIHHMHTRSYIDDRFPFARLKPSRDQDCITLHNDIKPSNCFYDEETSNTRLADLGLVQSIFIPAGTLQNRNDPVLAIPGGYTPFYASPEVGNWFDLDKKRTYGQPRPDKTWMGTRSDVCSLGKTLLTSLFSVSVEALSTLSLDTTLLQFPPDTSADLQQLITRFIITRMTKSSDKNSYDPIAKKFVMLDNLPMETLLRDYNERATPEQCVEFFTALRQYLLLKDTIGYEKAALAQWTRCRLLLENLPTVIHSHEWKMISGESTDVAIPSRELFSELAITLQFENIPLTRPCSELEKEQILNYSNTDSQSIITIQNRLHDYLSTEKLSVQCWLTGIKEGILSYEFILKLLDYKDPIYISHIHELLVREVLTKEFVVKIESLNDRVLTLLTLMIALQSNPLMCWLRDFYCRDHLNNLQATIKDLPAPVYHFDLYKSFIYQHSRFINLFGKNVIQSLKGILVANLLVNLIPYIQMKTELCDEKGKDKYEGWRFFNSSTNGEKLTAAKILYEAYTKGNPNLLFGKSNSAKAARSVLRNGRLQKAAAEPYKQLLTLDIDKIPVSYADNGSEVPRF